MQYYLQVSKVAEYYKCLPTPPEPPTTRTSLEDEGVVVSESRAASEFGDWSITFSFTAWATNGDVTLLLELAKHLEEVSRGRRGKGWILWGWFENFASVSGKSVMAVKERLEAMNKGSGRGRRKEWKRLDFVMLMFPSEISFTWMSSSVLKCQ